MNSVTIPMKFPSLNEYINLCRGNKYKAARVKKKLESQIFIFLFQLPKYQKPIRIHFHWVESDNRRDCDNIAFGKKFILDAMKKSGKIKDDSRKWLVGFTDTFETQNETKVILEVEEI